MTILQEIAIELDFDAFSATSLRNFNERMAHGNPLIGDDTDLVWYFRSKPYTFTIGYVDDGWVCEVTDDSNCETGIAQSKAHPNANAAFEDTRKQILEG